MTATRYILRRLARLVALLGVLTWTIGTVWSLLGNHIELFQRFGSLGVAASVLFFTDRLLKIELSRQKSVEKLLHEYGVELGAMKAGTDPVEIPDKGYTVDFLTEERKFDLLRQRADIYNVANVILMAVATIQWGFGDFFLRWIERGAV